MVEKTSAWLRVLRSTNQDVAAQRSAYHIVEHLSHLHRKSLNHRSPKRYVRATRGADFLNFCQHTRVMFYAGPEFFPLPAEIDRVYRCGSFIVVVEVEKYMRDPRKI